MEPDDSSGTAAAGLRALRTRSGIGLRELAALLGRSSSSYADYERTYKKRYQPVQLMQEVAQHLVGRGVPPITEAEVMALAGAQPDPSRTPQRRQEAVPEDGSGTTVVIREYDVAAAAGGGTEPPADWSGRAALLAEWVVPREFLPPEHRRSIIAIVRVEGESMAPALSSQDRVMVDVTQDHMGGDGIYLAWNGFGMVFKRLQALPGNPPKVRFSSDNPAYEPYVLTADEVKVFGRVIGKWVWW